MSAYTPGGMRLTSTGIRDCFEPGSLVACTTCFDSVIKGEVLAFDSQKKLLVLKCSPSNGEPPTCNVDIINLSYVKNVEMVKELHSVPRTQDRINTHKLHNRVKRAVEEKRCIINARSGGVCADGQKLFLTISRTIKEIAWQGQNIVLYDDGQIVITPPYGPDNVKGKMDGKAYTHIRKIVEKHFADIEKINRPSGSNKTAGKESNNNVSRSVNGNSKRKTKDEDYNMYNGSSSK